MSLRGSPICLAAVVASIVMITIAIGRPGEAQTVTFTLEQVFGSPATGLVVPFGTVDAACLTSPATGVTCLLDPSGSAATWYGTIQFRSRLTAGAGASMRLVGLRPVAGTMPAGRLVDSATGVPATAYPVAPAAPLTLTASVGGGSQVIRRRLGLRVLATDVSGLWATTIAYSLIIE